MVVQLLNFHLRTEIYIYITRIMNWFSNPEKDREFLSFAQGHLLEHIDVDGDISWRHGWTFCLLDSHSSYPPNHFQTHSYLYLCKQTHKKMRYSRWKFQVFSRILLIAIKLPFILCPFPLFVLGFAQYLGLKLPLAAIYNPYSKHIHAHTHSPTYTHTHNSGWTAVQEIMTQRHVASCGLTR